jgi:tryptophan-rich sensory protein
MVLVYHIMVKLSGSTTALLIKSRVNHWYSQTKRKAVLGKPETLVPHAWAKPFAES